MEESTFTVPIPSWAKKELEYVHKRVQETLPTTLQPFGGTDGLEVPGFEREPLRPYLLLLVARHYGCEGLRPLRLAASIHMIHIASLLHDRLGYAPRTSGIAVAADREHHQREALDILLGDFFFSEASRIIVEEGETRIIEENIRTSLASAETEARLVVMGRQLDNLVEPAGCFEVVADKVSLLLGLSLRVGAILGKADQEEEEALSDYGFLLGRAVRILDDLAIWRGLPWRSSPTPQETKFSHPLILLWEKEGRRRWREAADQLDACEQGALDALQTRLDEQGYLSASKGVAFRFAEQAIDRLDGFLVTEELRLLETIARFPFFAGQQRGQEVTL